ncbi:hypothetical protein Tco_1401125 [Tanacetum coccineum]
MERRERGEREESLEDNRFRKSITKELSEDRYSLIRSTKITMYEYCKSGKISPLTCRVCNVFGMIGEFDRYGKCQLRCVACFSLPCLEWYFGEDCRMIKPINLILVKLKIIEAEFLKKAPLPGGLDLDIMKAYEREITKRLRQREKMRRWESFLLSDGRSCGVTQVLSLLVILSTSCGSRRVLGECLVLNPFVGGGGRGLGFLGDNFLGGFLVDDEALEATFFIRIKKEAVAGFSQTLLREWVEVGLCKRLDQGCSCPPDQFLLDFEWERVTKMIPKEFEGEAFFHQSLYYAPYLRDGCNGPFSREHAYTFAHNTKDLRKFLKSETNLNIVDDEGDGDAYKTPIGCTPFRLVYGKSCHLHAEIKHNAYWAFKQCNMDLTAAAKKHFMELNELMELIDKAYENTRIYKERTKKWHDSRLRGDKNFKEGDKVLIFNSRFKIHPGKLKSKWYDPCVVKSMHPYETIEIIDKNGVNFKVNGHRLKKYHDGYNNVEEKEVVELDD